tara:strand:+ start:175 stop:1404 length:1230 start_codon:yes stop_codon:yes gene_type:complete
MKKIKEKNVGTLFDNKEFNAIKKVLKSGEPLTRGKEVELFERKFANYIGAKYAVSVSSCGAALNISTKILNLKKGDNVITQANAFWVTVVSLLEKNIKIIPVDIDPLTLNVDPKKIEEKINKKTKAIYLVHFGGNPANIQQIYKVARKYSIKVVEDCAHACGAKYNNNFVGSKSELACFSFSTHKNISTLGEGGMFVTNNKRFAELAKGLRTNFPWGIRKKRKFKKIGYAKKPKNTDFFRCGDTFDFDYLKVKEFGSTYRMSTVQAAVGIEQLKKLKKLNYKRSKIAKLFDKEINKLKLFKLLPKNKKHVHSNYIYSFFLNSNRSKISRDKILDLLDKKYSIKVLLRYWPIHLNGVMRSRGSRFGDCPNYERVWFKEQINLPVEPSMTADEVKRIVLTLRDLDKKFLKK